MSSKKQEVEWFFQIGAELQRLSDEVMRGIVATSAATRRFWRPNVDICESEDEVLITVELAGVEPETISVHFLTDTNGIVIRGVRTPTDVDNDERPIKRSHQLEVFYGEFERQITLPNFQTNRKAIRARFVNGMLCIIIPKRNKALEGRSISVIENHG
ncbi:MAG: Hsp20/alpha crystallin family protein [Fimbriimonadales bacterium]